jgi:hypothetical protein
MSCKKAALILVVLYGTIGRRPLASRPEVVLKPAPIQSRVPLVSIKRASMDLERPLV